jgi:putative oxidoreductase
MWNLVYTLGRVALVAIFIWSGLNKLMSPAGMNAMLAGKGFPQPMLFTYLAGSVELLLGLLVAVGWKTRLAAAGLVAFTIAATLIAHNFWDMTGQARTMNQIHFMKNLSIAGALLMLMAAGAGRYAVDRG